VKDKKMSFIRYFERAQPGKKRKIENEKTEKSKEYEAYNKIPVLGEIIAGQPVRQG
jgi:SOS-response transcriptional repressor LexA